MVYNFSGKEWVFKPGDRCAQMIVMPLWQNTSASRCSRVFGRHLVLSCPYGQTSRPWVLCIRSSGKLSATFIRGCSSSFITGALSLVMSESTGVGSIMFAPIRKLCEGSRGVRESAPPLPAGIGELLRQGRFVRSSGPESLKFAKRSWPE